MLWTIFLFFFFFFFLCVVFLSISEKNELVSQCGCEFVRVVCVCVCVTAREWYWFSIILSIFFVCIDNPRASVQSVEHHTDAQWLTDYDALKTRARLTFSHFSSLSFFLSRQIASRLVLLFRGYLTDCFFFSNYFRAFTTEEGWWFGGKVLLN